MNIDIDPTKLKDAKVEEVIFKSRKAQAACRKLLEALKPDIGMSQTRMASFAGSLDSCTQENFYVGPLRRLKNLGLLELVTLRRGQKKYIPIYQPISKHAHSPINSFANLAWGICKLWNAEFWEE